MSLSVAGLNAWYGPAHVLFDVALDVEAGSVTALLGRNGAGKSTICRAVMGLVPRRTGLMRLGGADISRLASHEIARRGLGYVPEDRRIFTDLTVEENLVVGEQPPRPGQARWTREKLFELFPNLAAMRNRLGRAMSGGEQQMLAIARTLIGNPTMILLDEPSEGLAPKIVEQMGEAVLAMKQEGVGVLLSEQNLRFARQTADRAFLVEKGRIRFSGTLAELDAAPDIRDAYLAV